MRWTAPPDRRELTLLLFSLIIFTLAYHMDYSFHIPRMASVVSQTEVMQRLGLAPSSPIGRDGLKPAVWRDDLETRIYGGWAWDAGRVAGNDPDRAQKKGEGRHGAMWAARDGKDLMRRAHSRSSSAPSIEQALFKWGDAIPRTRIQKHVQGYSVVDNVFLFRGKTYLVSDVPGQYDDLEAIATASRDWQVISPADATGMFGPFGGLCVLICGGDPLYNTTLISLWRTYASLAPTDGSVFSLSPPTRLILPRIRAFTDADLVQEQYLTKRARSDTGFHPYTLKSAFPNLSGVLYKEDCDDFHNMETAWLLERVVLEDSAAEQSAYGAFHLDAPVDWWEPARRNLAAFFDVDEPMSAAASQKTGKLFARDQDQLQKQNKKVLTYISTQNALPDRRLARLQDADHIALVNALRKLQSDGWEVHIVEAEGGSDAWHDRMESIARSNIVMGVYGTHMMDALFLQPGARSHIFEFFPGNSFVPDRERIARHVNVGYVAVQEGRILQSPDGLPSVSQPEEGREVSVSATVVVDAIKARTRS
ncbi:hypothetical protein FISHEDRAFT_53182 [Fistulina hepatica ATCC 64428]|nr:hypothetical protein FISHEDRAFT_53182 [Fistulina hepatica ATCC 64428]